MTDQPTRATLSTGDTSPSSSPAAAPGAPLTTTPGAATQQSIEYAPTTSLEWWADCFPQHQGGR